MTGATPPCSSEHRAPGAKRDRNCQPTAALPMKLKKPTRGSATIAWAKS